MVKIKLSLAVIIIFAAVSVQGQVKTDSVKITLTNAEKNFLERNLALLAAKYNISASEASIIQAGLWNNPNISIEQNIYNNETHKYFDITASGNTGIQIQQLFTLAGKKGYQVKLASINKEISEHNFADLLRNLKYQLRTDFYSLYYLQNSLKFYSGSILAIGKAINAINGIYTTRSVLTSEIMRLKSLLFSLENEQLNIKNQVSDIENDLNVLMNETGGKIYFEPQVDQKALDETDISQIDLESTINTALENRPDYKITDAAVRSEETNLELQKSLAVPDLTIGAIWSRQGGYIPNYYAMTVSIDLPVFNRNQGNIAVSENTLEADKKMKDQAKRKLVNDVINSFNKLIETDHLFKKFNGNFTNDYQKLVDGMISNYEKRYITIIEFTDFYESYRTSILQMNLLLSNRIAAIEDLNYKVGKDLLKIKN